MLGIVYLSVRHYRYMYLPYVQEVLNTYYIVSDYMEWDKTSWTCSVHLLFGISVVGAVRAITGCSHSELRVERCNEFRLFYVQILGLI